MSSRLIRGIALVAFAAGLPLAAFAQVVPPPPQSGPAGQPPAGAHRHGNPYMRALRSMNLSDSQKTQIKSIVQNYRQKNQGLDQAGRRANSQQMRADIMNVLTPSQRTQFEQTVRQMRQQYQSQGGQSR